MADNWTPTTIGELCEAVYDGPHATPKKTQEGPIFLGISNLRNGRIDLTSSEHLSEEDYARWTRRVTPQPGDVVFSYETRLGEAAIIPDGLKCCLGRRMALMRPDRSKVDPRFLLYAFLSREFQEEIRARTVPGSTVDRILLTEFPSFPVSVPPLDAQRAIAHVLGTLDDKIELNRQMNRTLDEIARTLFTSWFVNFDPVRAKAEGRQPEGMDAETAALFPDRFVDSELGPIPEGWEVKALGDIAEFNRSTVKPFDHPDTTFAHYSLPAFDSGQTPELALGGTIKSAKTRVPENAVLLSKLNPHIQRVWLPSICPEQEAAPIASTEFFVLTAKDGVPRSFIMALANSSSFQRAFATLATGTSNSHQRVRPGDAKQLTQAMPPASVLTAFAGQVDPLYQLMLANRDESTMMATLRDTLLPELLAGRLAIPTLQANPR